MKLAIICRYKNCKQPRWFVESVGLAAHCKKHESWAARQLMLEKLAEKPSTPWWKIWGKS